MRNILYIPILYVWCALHDLLLCINNPSQFGRNESTRLFTPRLEEGGCQTGFIPSYDRMIIYLRLLQPLFCFLSLYLTVPCYHLSSVFFYFTFIQLSSLYTFFHHSYLFSPYLLQLLFRFIGNTDILIPAPLLGLFGLLAATSLSLAHTTAQMSAWSLALWLWFMITPVSLPYWHLASYYRSFHWTI